MRVQEQLQEAAEQQQQDTRYLLSMRVLIFWPCLHRSSWRKLLSSSSRMPGRRRLARRASGRLWLLRSRAQLPWLLNWLPGCLQNR